MLLAARANERNPLPTENTISAQLLAVGMVLQDIAPCCAKQSQKIRILHKGRFLQICRGRLGGGALLHSHLPPLRGYLDHRGGGDPVGRRHYRIASLMWTSTTNVLLKTLNPSMQRIPRKAGRSAFHPWQTDGMWQQGEHPGSGNVEAEYVRWSPGACVCALGETS